MITLKEHLIRQKINKKNEDFIDLCLPSGTLWCTHNIGADNPEDTGYYFAWGETEQKTDFSWDNYKFGSKLNLTKYNSKDGLTHLQEEDNVADKYIPGSRIPSVKEINELFNNTKRNYYISNNVPGILVTSRKDKHKTLFFPFVGFMDKNRLLADDSTEIFLLCSDLYTSINMNYMYMQSNKKRVYYGVEQCGRKIGMNIRPVK